MSEALIIVDVQHDLCPGGAVPVPGGDEVVARLHELIGSGRFAAVVASRDWHPPDHASFEEQGGSSPPHCVQGTPGAELHEALAREPIALLVDKGTRRDAPGHSAFEETGLAEWLRDRGIDRVTVAGLALDTGVRHTAIDALHAGFAVTVDRAGSRPLEASPGDGERALIDVREAGGDVEE